MTYLLPQAPTPAVEYEVRFTTLDTRGAERKLALPEGNLHDAIEACDHIQTNQECYQLPVDACVWCRTDGGPWHRWAGESR